MNTYELKFKSELDKLTADEVSAIKEFVSDGTTKDYVSIRMQDVETFGYEHTELYGMYDMTYAEVTAYHRSGGLWLYSCKNEVQDLFV